MALRRTRGRRTSVSRRGGPWIAAIFLIFVLGTPTSATAANHPTSRPSLPILSQSAPPGSAGTAALPPVTVAPSGTGILPPAGVTDLMGFGPRTVQERSNPFGEPTLRGLPSGERPVGPGMVAPVVNGSFVAAPQNHTQLFRGAGFEGINNTQCGCDPPDVQDAVGPHDVVEMVNLYIEVWDANGAALAGESLASFYGTSNYLSDPRVVYDNVSGRFFASILAINSTVGSVYFAVSEGSRAAGNWTLYKVLHSPAGSFPDQPILGLNATLLGFGGNVYGGSFSGAAEYWVVNKSAVLNGSSAPYDTFGPDASGFSIHPLRTVGSSEPLYFVETLGGDPGTVDLFRVSGIPPATTSVTTTSIAVGAISSPPHAPTPDGGAIDAATARVADAIDQGGHLYVTFGDQCLLASQNLSCVRLVVLNTTPSLTVAQDFDVAMAGTFLYYPAISLDAAGDLTVVVGLSSTTLDPSIAAFAQRASDAPGSISPFVWIHQGTAGRPRTCNPSCRFGDYFGSGADPTTSAIWVSGEFLTSSTVWQTWLSPVAPAGPTSFAVRAPTIADIGQSVNATLDPTNSPCGLGWATWCSFAVPLGDGTTFRYGCGSIGGPLAVPLNFSISGNLSIGTGGTVAAFATSNCSSASLLATYPIQPAPIQVDPSLAVVLSVDDGGANDLGQSVNFSATVYGGSPISAFQWTDLPPGCPAANRSVIDCQPNTTGTAIVGVRVTDASGANASSVLSYTVDPGPSVTLSVTPDTLDLGANFSMVASASGGAGSFRYTWWGLPPGCDYPDQPDQTCTPLESGEFIVSVSATDPNGVTATSAGVEVSIGTVLSVRLTDASTGASSGPSSTVTATVSGGLGPYSWNWSGLPSACAASAGRQANCSFPNGATEVSVTVRDAAGSVASDRLTVRVAARANSSWYSGSTAVPLAIGLLAVVAVAILLLRRRVPPPAATPPKVGR